MSIGRVVALFRSCVGVFVLLAGPAASQGQSYLWESFVGRANFPAGSTDGTGEDARFSSIGGLAIDSTGTIYASDSGNHTIRKVTPEGVVTTFVGTAGITGSADGTGADARFFNPRGLAFDENDNLYVADISNRTIRKVTPAGEVTTIAGNPGVTGTADGQGSAAEFTNPVDITYDPDLDLFYISAVSVRTMTLGGLVGTLTTPIGSNSLEVAATGDIFLVSSDDCIRKVTPGGTVTVFAGSPPNNGSTDGTGSAARFFNPTGITVDANGIIYVCEQANALIRRITPAAEVTTIGGAPVQNGSAGGIGSAARFRDPQAIVVDSNGVIYVGDSSNRRIVRGTLLTGPQVTTLPATGVSAGGATLKAEVTPSGSETQVKFLFATNPGLTGAQSTPLASIGSGGSVVPVSQALSGLLPSTTYYFAVEATNSTGTAQGAVESFTTTALQAPTVSTNTAVNVAASTATLRGEVNPNFQATTARFAYGTDAGLAGAAFTPTQATGSGGNPVSLTANLSDLVPNTTYYFRVLATNGTGAHNGSILSFTTTPLQPPFVSTQTPISVSPTRATLRASVKPGGQATTGQFAYGTDPALAGATSTVSVNLGSSTGTVTLQQGLSGLTPATTYYFRASATNAVGQTDGSILSVNTPALIAPTATTLAAINLTFTGATVKASVNPNGQATTVRFLSSTDSLLNGATATATVEVGSGVDPVSLSQPLTGLAPATTYHFRVEATNVSGTTSGSILSFATETAVAPIVTTEAASSVTYSGAALNATVNPKGQATNVSFEYGTDPALAGASTTAAFAIGNGGAIQFVTRPLNNLVAATTYYFRVVAENASGTNRGTILNFTTTTLPAPPQPQIANDDDVPNQPGTTFVDFGFPAVDGGRVGGLVTVQTDGGRPQSAVFGGDDGEILASTGGPAPGGAGQVFTKLGDPIFAGEAFGFAGTAVGPAATLVPSENGRAVRAPRSVKLSGLWSQQSRAAGLNRLAAQGQLAPGAGGAPFAKFPGFSLPRNRPGLVFTGQLKTGNGVTNRNNFGIWREKPEGGSELLLRSGSELVLAGGGSKNVKSVTLMTAVPQATDQRRSIAPDGAVGVAAKFDGTDSGIVLVAADGTAEVAAETRSAVPGLPGATWERFFPPATASGGLTAFLSQLKKAAGGITARNNTAVFRRTANGGMEMMMQRGDPVPRLDGVRFDRLGDPLLGQSGMLALMANLAGQAVTPRNRQAVVLRREGENTIAARLGDPAPGMGEGVVFRRFLSVVVTDAPEGRLVFSGTVGGPGINVKNNKGLWSVSPSGVVTLVLRTSGTVNTGDEMREVRVLSALDAPSGNRGQGRSTDAAGFVTVRVTLDNKRRGVLRLPLP